MSITSLYVMIQKRRENERSEKRMRPVIGVLSKHYRTYENRKPDVFVRDEIKQAVFDNGGIAIGIFPTQEKIVYAGDEWKDTLTQKEREDLIAQIQLCDGILIQGGLETDLYECIVARYCYEQNIPILGICAGQNIIARALGGTTKEVQNPEDHDRSFDEYVHSISIQKNSKFYQIVEVETMKVNSRHRRTLATYPNLEVVAVCEDGYPDVVESKEKDFYLGVRFHPESLYQKDEKMRKIFEAFLNAAKQGRENRK